jgi:hypothetical protein
MAAAVLACVAASATFAFEFGWTRGATDIHSWTFAGAGVALDLFKCGLPIFAAAAWHDSKVARSLACWFVFVVFTSLSLWCAYGTTATQLAERIATKAVAVTDQAQRQSTLDRLRAERDALPTYAPTTAESVKAADDAVNTAATQARAECNPRGPRCRDREADERTVRAALILAKTNKATTDRANELEAKITVAEAALNAVDLRAVSKESDPQAASMAKAIGTDQNLIAAISHAAFAIAIELGSGFGFWLVFGHGRHAHEEPKPERAPVYVPAPTRSLAATKIIEEMPAEIIERFFLEVVRPTLNRRVRAIDAWSAYGQWCSHRGLEPVSHAMFGRLARWRKERLGGSVWYLDAELADGYGAPKVRALQVRPSVSRELRVVASN